MRIHSGEIAEVIKSQIKNYSEKIVREDTGVVLSVSDGIAHISGLDSCMSGEMLEFENGGTGLALNLEADSVAAAVLSGAEDIREGMQVKRCGHLLSVPVGEGLLGRVVDALGNAVDGKGGIKTDAEYPIESPAPGIMQRRSVYRPLETGVKAVDSMIPIGRGQRELIIGDRQTGKTSLAIDTIINQHGKNMVCIYVAIGQKQTTVAGIAQLLEREDAMAYSIIITEAASASPAMQYIAPFSGCAMAEFFMRSGRDVLIVYDDLSKHAAAYRALSLLLRRPPGREAYPGDVFYLHSRLLERAVQLSDSEGGGSITALPIIETLSGDVSAYIPTNVISITDGQIFLESEMFRSGLMPAIDPGISVSRVGGSAQYPAMRKMSGKLRIMYSQYRELKSFSQFGTDLDADTRSKLEQGRRMEEVFRQNRSSAVPFEKQAAILFALINGYIDRVQPEKVCAYEAGLYGYLDMNCAQLLQRIRESGDISAETEAELRAALCAYSEIFSESGGKNGG